MKLHKLIIETTLAMLHWYERIGYTAQDEGVDHTNLNDEIDYTALVKGLAILP